jgi:hypothetical protein
LFGDFCFTYTSWTAKQETANGFIVAAQAASGHFYSGCQRFDGFILAEYHRF